MEEKDVKTPVPETEQPEEKAESAKKTEAKPKKNKKNEEAESLKKQLEKAEKELADQKEAYQRVLAEYANYKRRTEQEKQELGQFTKGELMKALLDSVDNMERALAAEDGDNYKTGVDMTFRNFRETLSRLGLEEIEAEGAAFDPELHNAVMREDAEEGKAEMVTQVFQKGYKLGNRVLRPAMVKVAN